MTSDEIKEIIKLARRHRVKSMSIAGLSFELRPSKKKPIQIPEQDKPPKVSLPPVPTLDQINDHIYKDKPEEGDL